MKKRVGVLSAQVPFVSGGAELLSKNLVKALRERGFDADIISMPYKWYPEFSLYDSMMLWRMADLSESDGMKLDLLIPTKFPSYGIKHPNKVTWLVHQFRQVYDLYDGQYGYKHLPEGARIRSNVIKYDSVSLNECKGLYSISDTVRDRAKKYTGVDCETLYHPPALVGRYYNEDYGNYILSVGRLDRLKRNELLIESLRYCDPEVHALIAGRGAEMENLQTLIQKYGLEERVKLLGFVPDEELLKLYASAFAVFFAPLDEDYGYITLEAFLSNKPVITTTDAGGVLEFVHDGINGYVCQASPELIGSKIEFLYRNKKCCEEFGHEGYEAVKDISWDNVIDTLTSTIR